MFSLTSLPSSVHILFGLRLDSSNIFFYSSILPLVIVIHVLSFKRITHGHLLKALIKHNKKRIHLSNLLINCMSARSVPQILSIKTKQNFIF